MKGEYCYIPDCSLKELGMCTISGTCNRKAIQPEPDEAAESARTKCSPAASSPDSFGTTASQLAHSLGSGTDCNHKPDGEIKNAANAAHRILRSMMPKDTLKID